MVARMLADDWLAGLQFAQQVSRKQSTLAPRGIIPQYRPQITF